MKVNYRTSHQIRSQSDRLLGKEVSDVDGNSEERSGTILVFDGPVPGIEVLPMVEAEIQAVSGWIPGLKDAGVHPHEIAIFVRSPTELDRAKGAASAGWTSIRCSGLEGRCRRWPHLN